MKIKLLIIAALLLLTTSCKSQAAVPIVPVVPTETFLPATATIAPTETPLPTETRTSLPTPSDIFGAIALNSVQAFSIEPVAQAIFDHTLDGYVSHGTMQEYRVDSISVFPSGSGGLIAEIMYSLRADNDPWPDDFGTLGPDGWITGKCSRFDLVATDTEHQLKNKRLCN